MSEHRTWTDGEFDEVIGDEARAMATPSASVDVTRTVRVSLDAAPRVSVRVWASAGVAAVIVGVFANAWSDRSFTTAPVPTASPIVHAPAAAPPTTHAVDTAVSERVGPRPMRQTQRLMRISVPVESALAPPPLAPEPLRVDGNEALAALTPSPIGVLDLVVAPLESGSPLTR